ncbi:hypothetical protein FNV43_RR23209 [Rhamnella rubrinervis]|uniref:F-box domain-containing protein n=1 Tax=Rhamnella rubrinervis TaxID=2594499 RepID=A0A8K0E3C9_9ROSA|nr:hypothetical protein FNV43_RR23209 [Rhamnella rubrinervis]
MKKLPYGRTRMLEMEDSISALSDEILVSILCCMPLREAQKTSLLSRRWRNLWKRTITARDSLDLVWPVSYGARRAEFVDWVHEVLRLRDSVETLDGLRVSYDLNSTYNDHFSEWVAFACKKGVKRLEFDLTGCNRAGHIFPCGFPEVEAVNAMSRPPASPTSFYCLTDLCLIDINVSGETLHYLQLNSPFLERLIAKNSQSLIDLNVVSASLKHLEIAHCHLMNWVRIISAPALQRLDVYSCSRIAGLTIYAPNLVSFRYDGRLIDVPFNHVPVLSEVSLGSDYPKSLLRHTGQLFGHFSQLRRLKLNMEYSVFNYLAERFYQAPRAFPALSNLKELEMTLSTRQDMCLLWPCALVKAAPLLRRLVIKMTFEGLGEESDEDEFDEESDEDGFGEESDEDGFGEDSDEDGFGGDSDEDLTMLVCESWEIREVTSCTHHFLEVVELSGFTGRHNTVDLLLHLVEIAPSLKELIIDGRNPFSFDEETEGASGYAQKLRAHVSEEINLVVR